MDGGLAVPGIVFGAAGAFGAGRTGPVAHDLQLFLIHLPRRWLRSTVLSPTGGARLAIVGVL